MSNETNQMTIDWSKFKNKVIHTPTRNDFEAVIKYDYSEGLSRGFSTYGKETSINFNEKLRGGKSYYADKSYYEGMNYEIITTQEFLREIEAQQGVETLKEATQKDSNSGVGNIASSEKGSGARYNNGKPDYSLLVISDYVEYLRLKDWDAKNDSTTGKALNVLHFLGEFQKTHEIDCLYEMLQVLGDDAIEESTHVLTYGKQVKYKAWNWAKGMDWSIPVGCIIRHCNKILKGETIDDESKRHHFGHVVANILMLTHFCKYYKEGNDLPDVKLFEGE